jgi:hypothetical protein
LCSLSVAIPLVGSSGLAPARAADSPLCAGDGVSGKRIHLWYAWQSQDQYSVDVVKIRRIVGEADARLSAIGGQHYRFVCSSGQIIVDKVHVTSSTLDAFKAAVKAMGYTSTDRIYNAFEPEASEGRGDTTNDDRPDPTTNAANRGPHYSSEPFVLDLFMHEVGHNLGAVQNSAPHSTGASHCWDQQDVLCYNDGGPYFQKGGQLETVCGDGVLDTVNRWDCNLDDYYNPNPPPGSYLATHWNTRNSYFLTPAAPVPPTSPPTATTPPPAPAGLRVVSTTASSITMAWNAVSDPDGIAAYSLEVRRTGLGPFAVACETSALTCSASGVLLLLGPSFQFRVRARDGSGTWGPYSAVVAAKCSTAVCL